MYVAINPKDILYSAIDEIGRERIRMEIAASVEASEKYCIEILEKCKKELGSGTSEETLVSLCEALLHFLLTASLLPSERKIRMRGVDLDIVIPSSRILAKDPERSLVIQIVGREYNTKLTPASTVQPHPENIWLISANLLTTKYRNYHLGLGNFQYSKIVSDISSFLLRNGDSGLKLLHGQ